MDNFLVVRLLEPQDEKKFQNWLNGFTSTRVDSNIEMISSNAFPFTHSGTTIRAHELFLRTEDCVTSCLNSSRFFVFAIDGSDVIWKYSRGTTAKYHRILPVQASQTINTISSLGILTSSELNFLRDKLLLLSNAGLINK